MTGELRVSKPDVIIIMLFGTCSTHVRDKKHTAYTGWVSEAHGTRRDHFRQQSEGGTDKKYGEGVCWIQLAQDRVE